MNPRPVWFIGGTLCLLCGCAGISPDSSSNSSISYNQQIQQDSQEIAEMRSDLVKELPSYSPDYIKRVVQVLGTCQKALESPRFMMGSIRSDASSQLDALKLDFPQERASVANKELQIIIDKIGALDDFIDSTDYKPYTPAAELAVEGPLTDYIKNSTEMMHDVLVNQAQ